MSPTVRKYIVAIIHIIIWVCLFLYPFLFHYISLGDAMAVTRIGSFIVLLMVLFYGNTFVLIPKLLGKKRVVLYLLSIAGLIAGVSFASGYLQIMFNPEYLKKPELYRISFNTALILSIITWFISSAMKVTAEWFRNQQQMRIIENEKLNAELNFLRSQVNPHFLFNALNNIYAMQNQGSKDTGAAILKLSDLVRYMLYETSSELVPLEKEIAYLQNYVDLQRLSISSKVDLMFDVQGDLTGKKIEPMLLIPLIENVFKHGISYKQVGEVSIKITCEANTLALTTRNPVTDKKATASGSGIGLENLNKRLYLLYPGKHQLLVENKEGIFRTTLRLELKP